VVGTVYLIDGEVGKRFGVVLVVLLQELVQREAATHKTAVRISSG
jgi:hypothetical protein